MDPIFSYAAGILRGPQEALPSGDTIPGTFTEIIRIPYESRRSIPERKKYASIYVVSVTFRIGSKYEHFIN